MKIPFRIWFRRFLWAVAVVCLILGIGLEILRRLSFGEAHIIEVGSAGRQFWQITVDKGDANVFIVRPWPCTQRPTLYAAPDQTSPRFAASPHITFLISPENEANWERFGFSGNRGSLVVAMNSDGTVKRTLIPAVTDEATDPYMNALDRYRPLSEKLSFWEVDRLPMLMVEAPFAIPFVLGVATVFFKDIRTRRRRGLGRCVRCNHDLRSSETTCPECGLPRDRS